MEIKELNDQHIENIYFKLQKLNYAYNIGPTLIRTTFTVLTYA